MILFVQTYCSLPPPSAALVLCLPRVSSRSRAVLGAPRMNIITLVWLFNSRGASSLCRGMLSPRFSRYRHATRMLRCCAGSAAMSPACCLHRRLSINMSNNVSYRRGLLLFCDIAIICHAAVLARATLTTTYRHYSRAPTFNLLFAYGRCAAQLADKQQRDAAARASVATAFYLPSQARDTCIYS